MSKTKPIDLKIQISKNIAVIRERLGMSREGLARKAKVSARYVYALEQGDRNLSIDTLEAVAKALNCTVCDLICTPEKPSLDKEAAIELAIAILGEELSSLKAKSKP